MVENQNIVPKMNNTNDNIVLLKGYAGTGKTYTLLKLYNDLISDEYVNLNEVIYITEYEYEEFKDVYTVPNNKFICTSLNDLIITYLKYTDNLRFHNTFSLDERERQLRNIINGVVSSIVLPQQLIDNELRYIQTNIFVESNSLKESLLMEKNQYMAKDRKKNPNNFLNYKEKEYIWQVYKSYIEKCENDDSYDIYGYYHAFLRFINEERRNNKMGIKFKYIFLDEAQLYNKIQLDIIYAFLNVDDPEYQAFITYDPIKSIKKNGSYIESNLFKFHNKELKLLNNYRSNKALHKLIVSSLTQNDLYNFNDTYECANENEHYPVLTHDYNGNFSRELEILYEHVKYLNKLKKYSLDDIMVVVPTKEKLIKLEEFLVNHEIDIKHIYIKDNVTNKEFKNVILLGLTDGDFGVGPLNRILNTSINMKAAYSFYKVITRCSDYLVMISTSSKPSHFIARNNIGYENTRYNIDSQIISNLTFTNLSISNTYNWLLQKMEEKHGFKYDSNKRVKRGYLIKGKINTESQYIYVCEDLAGLDISILNELFDYIDKDEIMFASVNYYTIIRYKDYKYQRLSNKY